MSTPLVLKVAAVAATVAAVPWAVVTFAFTVAAFGLFPCDTRCPTQPLVGWTQLGLAVAGIGLVVAGIDELGERRRRERRGWARGATMLAGAYYCGLLWWLLRAEYMNHFPF